MSDQETVVQKDKSLEQLKIETPPEPQLPESQTAFDQLTEKQREVALETGVIPPAEPEKVEPKPEPKEPEAAPSKEKEKPSPPEAGLIAGKFKSQDDFERSYLELETKLGEQRRELGDMRKEQPQPEPSKLDTLKAELKELGKPPEIDPLDQQSMKDYGTYYDRKSDLKAEIAEEKAISKATSIVEENENLRPVKQMVDQFYQDHPGVAPEMVPASANRADSMAAKLGKSVSLEEGYQDLITSLGISRGDPSTGKSEPQPSPSENGNAAAIKEAEKIPKTVADVPTTPAPTVKESDEVKSQAEWNALSKTEQDRRMMDIPPPLRGVD